MDADTIYAINRLIYFSLICSSGSKNRLKRNSDEITELIQRFQAEEAFRQMVKKGLAAMELRILAIEESGLRLSARGSDSFFATTVTDYGKLLGRSEFKAAELLSIHCAIATAFFPTESQLEEAVEDLGAIVMEDIIDILRRFALAEASLPEDDDRLHPQVRTVARRLQELPEENPDSIRAGAGNSWVDLANRILEHMEETGYLLLFREKTGVTEYRPTPAYQTAMKEGSVYAYQAFRDIMKEKEPEEAPSETVSASGEKRDV